MKRSKSLALLAVIALVINIFAPTIVNADLVIDGKAALEVFQSDLSGLAIYSGNELKVTINDNSQYGSFWGNVDVGSNITLEYTPMENYVFDGWYDSDDEIVSTNPTYSFVMGSQDYTLRAQISRADGKSAVLDANPFWSDFGWHTPDFEVDYRTITVTNNGNLTIKNLTIDYDNTKLDLVYDSSDDVFNSMAPGDSFTYQVKPISGAFEIAEYPHDEWILFNGYIDLDEQNQFYHSEAIVEIGINETGENPYGNEDTEIVVDIEGYDQKPVQGSYLPEWIARGANEVTTVVPEGTHWEMYYPNENEWAMAPREPITNGHYRYMVEIAVSRDVDETVEVLLQGDGIPDGTWYVMNVDRVEIDPLTYERHIFAYTNEVDFSVTNEYATVRYNANGGTPGEYFSEEVQYVKGSMIYVLNPSPTIMTPPEGKVFDGYIVNGNRYYIGQSIVINEDLNIGYVWKDDPYADYTPIYNAHLTLIPPEVGTTNEARIVDLGGYGYTEGSIKPTVTTQPDEEIIVTDTEWVKGTYETAGDEYQDIFEGTFEEGNYYYALINFEAKDGYVLDNNVEITVNNKAPAEVFGIYDRTSTMVIARIAAGEVQPEENSRVQVIMNESANNNNRGTFTINNSSDYNSTKVDFYPYGTQITLTATPNEYNTFAGWYNCEEYDISGDAGYGIMGWRTVGDALTTGTTYTFTTNAIYYNIMPVFESRVGHNNIWMTGDGEIAVYYENRDVEEQPLLDGEHWQSNGIVVDYTKGDSITLKARAKEGSHFVGWFITDRAASVPANYVRTPVISTNTTYTYIPSITTIKVDGVDEALNYITAVFEEGEATFTKGDMNNDTFINSTDAAMVLDKFKNNNATTDDFARGDMDNNNILNATDAAMILDIFKNS